MNAKLGALTGACLSVAALGLFGCGSSYQAEATPVEYPAATAARPSEAVQPSQVAAAVQNLPEPDRGFVLQASGAHMAAIRFGQLAMEKGATEKVREIGKEMVDTHTAFSDKLRETARTSANVILPIPRLTASQQRDYQRLSRLSGAEFDRAFLDAVLRVQQETIQSFNNEALNGQSPAIREFANQSLPQLNERVRTVRREMRQM
jgi:putative membrane protein